MSRQISIFQFRLRNGSSIGPDALKRIWAAASGSDDVTVARELRRLGAERPQHHLYSLGGPSNLPDLPAIESRLKTLLQAALAVEHVELTRLV
ncbi:MAG TPA: hypothetical protein VGC30_13390 [Dokdonella sp.]